MISMIKVESYDVACHGKFGSLGVGFTKGKTPVQEQDLIWTLSFNLHYTREIFILAIIRLDSPWNSTSWGFFWPHFWHRNLEPKHLRHWQRLSSRFMTLVEELYPCWSWNEESQWRNSFVKKIKRHWKKKNLPRNVGIRQPHLVSTISTAADPDPSEGSNLRNLFWLSVGFLGICVQRGAGPPGFLRRTNVWRILSSFQMVYRCDHFKPFAKPMLSLSEATLSLSWHHRRSSVGFGTSRGAWGWFCLPTICGFCSSQGGEGFQPTVSTVGIVRVSNRFPLNNQDQTAAWNIFVNIHAFQHIHFGRTKLF